MQSVKVRTSPGLWRAEIKCDRRVSPVYLTVTYYLWAKSFDWLFDSVAFVWVNGWWMPSGNPRQPWFASYSAVLILYCEGQNPAHCRYRFAAESVPCRGWTLRLFNSHVLILCWCCLPLSCDLISDLLYRPVCPLAAVATGEDGEGEKCRDRDSLLLAHPPHPTPPPPRLAHCQHR